MKRLHFAFEMQPLFCFLPLAKKEEKKIPKDFLLSL